MIFKKYMLIFLFITFFISCSRPVNNQSVMGLAVSPEIRYLSNTANSNLSSLHSGARFLRDANGVISDRETGLQWLEGPDQPTSWEQAQTWISGLGNDWRTPTLEELTAIYLPDSTRKGKYGDPLCLDPTFKRESGYALWSVARFDGTAWIYDFSRGYAHWIDTYYPGRFDRAVAVRKSRKELNKP